MATVGAFFAFGSVSLGQEKATTIGRVDVDDHSKIDALISELSSDRFEIRQAAWEVLRKIGPATSPYLEKSLPTADREAAERIRLLLAANRLKLPTDVSYEMIESLANFGDLAATAQLALIQRLAAAQEIKLILDLLEQCPDQEKAIGLLRQNVNLQYLLVELAAKDKFEVLPDLVMHPFAQRHFRELRDYYLMIFDKLPEFVDQTLTDAKSKDLNDDQVIDLIGMLSKSSRNQEALIWADRIGDEKKRKSVRDQLHINLRDWQFIWDQNQSGWELPDASHGADILASPETVQKMRERLVLARFLNRTDDYQSTRDCIAKVLEATSKEQDVSTQTLLLSSLFLNGDVDLALSRIKTVRPAEGLRISNFLLRLDISRDILALDDDVEKRWKWIESKFRTLRALERKYARTNDQSDQEKVYELSELIYETANYFGLIGLNEFATAILEQAANETAKEAVDSFERRQKVVAKLAADRKKDTLWLVISNNFTNSEYEFWYLGSTLFPFKTEPANFWYRHDSLVSQPEIDRLKTIARLLNEPLVDAGESFDLDKWIGDIDHSHDAESHQNLPGDINYNLAMVCLYHRRFQEFESFAQTAIREFKHPAAGLIFGIRAYDQCRWDDAIDAMSVVWKNADADASSRALAAMIASHCYAQQQNPEMANNLKLVSFLIVDRELAGNVGRILTENGFSKEVAMLLTESPEDADSSTVFRSLRDDKILALENFNDELAYQESEILMYELSVSYSSANLLYPIRVYGDSIINKAKWLAAKGQTDDVEKLIADNAALLYCDAGLSENLLSAMIARGQTESAAKIFQNQSEWFLSRIREYPDSSLLLNNFAWCAACTGKYIDLATYISERSLQVCPQQKNYLDTLAALYHLQGRTSEAIDLTLRTLDLDPSNPSYRRRLGEFQSDANKSTN